MAMLNSIIEATQKGATSIVVGGDTTSLLKKVKGAEGKISHVSEGGKTSLELLEGKNLPGIVTLSDSLERKVKEKKLTKKLRNLRNKLTKLKNRLINNK